MQYDYDAWGNIIAERDANGGALSGSLLTYSEMCPFRYRGYYYDSDTGLYYLQSRYYDPQTGRFLNTDDRLNTDSVLGYNTFAYCENNPVNMSDPTGHFILAACIIGGAIIGAITGGAIGASVSKIKTGKVSAKSVVMGALAGCAVGAVAGAVLGAIGQVASTVISVSMAGSSSVAAPIANELTERTYELYNSWQSAEESLRTSIESVLPKAERTFSTPIGTRICDAYSPVFNTIGESKYGYQSLTSFISSEIQKDSWLLHNGGISCVEWHFYYSPISNTIGPSVQLYNELVNAGFTIVFH